MPCFDTSCRVLTALAIASCGGELSWDRSDGGSTGWQPGLSDDRECDLSKPFGEQLPLVLSRPALRATLSPDELHIYVESPQDPGTKVRPSAVYFGTRSSRSLPFSELALIASIPLGSFGAEYPSISRDELRIFVRHHPSTLVSAVRASLTSDFKIDSRFTLSEPISLYEPYVVDEEGLYSMRPEPIVQSIVQRRWEGGSWTAPERVAAGGHTPVVSQDHRTIYFFGSGGVRVAYRNGRRGAFGRDAPVPTLRGIPTWLSPNGCRVYLSTGVEPTIAVAQRAL
jgi:hypothetical protein